MITELTPSWIEETRGLCPMCLRDVPARLIEDGGNVWIEQTCKRHGTNRALIAADAAEYHRLRRYVPPRVSACCGPGEACDTGKPPTCILILEITQACNLRCPTCYADAQGHDFMPVTEAKRRLDAFFAAQQFLDVLMLSGGEPTIHPALLEVLDLALTYPINRVLINTNGLRLAQSPDLVRALSLRRRQIELYFSFSSFRAETQERLYGRDVREMKKTALTAAGDAGIFINLVATVEAGINDDELGDLYRFALTQETISGLVVQPVMDTGRYEHGYAPKERMTLTGVLRALDQQTNGEVRTTDFAGLPCSHPDCAALTYGFLNADRSVMTPLTRHLDVSQYLDLFTDRISFSGLLASAARRIWDDVKAGKGAQSLGDIGRLLSLPAVRAMLPLLGDPDKAGRRIFRVVVKPFMDAHTYDAKRIDQCCTKIVNERGEAVSFCEYNVFHRGRKMPDGVMSLKMTTLPRLPQREELKRSEPMALAPPVAGGGGGSEKNQ